MKQYVKKIYITIPMELFNELYHRKELADLDNLITDLLIKHFRLEDEE